MFKFDSRKMIIAVFPFVILVIAWMLSMETLVSYNRLNVVFVTLPYILAFFSLVLSIWFQHSRVFYAVAMLLFTMAVIPTGDRLNSRAIINGISLMIPLVFILLAVTEERGITSIQGLIKGTVFLLSGIFIVIDAGGSHPCLNGLRVSELTFGGSEKIPGVPRWSIFLFIVCLCILLTRFLVLSSTLDTAFTGVSLGSFIILHFSEYTNVLSVFYSAVFLIFIIALFEASYSLAFHDTLTGILSRRAMEQEILRLGSKYAVAMVDIDRFKRINDTYGHQVGDDVLKMIAVMVEKNTVGGKAFRYGGEEFVVIFPRKSAEEVIEQLDRLRINIEKRPLVLRGANRPKKKPKYKPSGRRAKGTVRVTVSIGIADKNERYRSATEVINAADKALYKAKRNGRNCIVY